MDAQKLQGLLEEADDLKAADPDFFESNAYDQPPGMYVSMAEELLGEEAPWYRVAYVAHAIKDEEEASLYEL